MPVQGDENDISVDQEASEEQQSEEKEMCRDFKKGDCRRGERCMYHHPKLDICRDFKKGECTRRGCRFAHLTHEEEEFYTRNGSLPDHLGNGQAMKAVASGGGVGLNAILGRNIGTAGLRPQVPEISEHAICRDFEKGDCRRGTRCKFFHPKLKLCRDFQNKKCERENCRFLHFTREEEETYEGSGITPDHIDKAEVKRKRVMAPPPSMSATTVMGAMYGKRRREDNLDSMSGLANPSYATILQENQTLKSKLTEMQQQITDLRRMNDTLYEQNANYRLKSNTFGGI